MTIENLISLAEFDNFKICIYNFYTQKDLFDDVVKNIPIDLVHYDIDSWGLYNNKLYINVDIKI